MMIPKVINYCWFGNNPLDKRTKKCIDSWKKYCPDYQIVQWNESNFDTNCCDYVKEAYKAKKWAFVSDYARFKILYEHGGIYLDTDVQLIKSIDDLVNKGPYMGYEAYCNNDKLNPNHESLVNSGLGMAAEPHMEIFKEILDYYESQHFLYDDGSINQMTVVERVTKILKKHGLTGDGKLAVIKGLTVYPEDYLCPFNFTSGKTNITDNTYSIHLYSASWQSSSAQFKNKIKRYLPVSFVNLISKIKHHE